MNREQYDRWKDINPNNNPAPLDAAGLNVLREMYSRAVASERTPNDITAETTSCSLYLYRAFPALIALVDELRREIERLSQPPLPWKGD